MLSLLLCSALCALGISGAVQGAHAGGPLKGEAAADASALLSLRAAVANWDDATAAFGSRQWSLSNGPPCGSEASPTGSWLGVMCRHGRVSELNLAGLGLAGTLPPQLAALHLTRMNLRRNDFHGPIPPAYWQQAFNSSVEAPLVVALRPGNERLCGPVVPVNSQIYMRELLPTLYSVLPPMPVPTASLQRTGNITGNVLMTHEDLFLHGTSVTLTGWLGSCAAPCAAGAQPSLALATNLFDLSWQHGLALSDLLLLNPGAASARPGASLSAPCYPQGSPRSGYYGSDVAFGGFSGGHQVAGMKGVGGAMAAARINGALLNLFNPHDEYRGSVGPDDGFVAQPRYWFVDLGAPFTVTAVLIAADAPMLNVSLYVVSDSANLFANQLVAAGLRVAAGQQLAVPVGGAVGRFVVVYAGFEAECDMALDNVQVYAAESNAAARKPVLAALPHAKQQQQQPDLQQLADGDPSTCVQLQPGDDGTALAVVDLGYFAPFGSVAVAAAAGLPAGASAQVSVLPADQRHAEAAACGPANGALELQPGGWAAQACTQAPTGRYVAIRVAAGGAPVELCEIHVHLLLPPSAVASGQSSGGGKSCSGLLGGSNAAGAIAIALLVAGLSTLLTSYLKWRHECLQQDAAGADTQPLAAAAEVKAPRPSMQLDELACKAAGAALAPGVVLGSASRQRSRASSLGDTHASPFAAVQAKLTDMSNASPSVTATLPTGRQAGSSATASLLMSPRPIASGASQEGGRSTPSSAGRKSELKMMRSFVKQLLWGSGATLRTSSTPSAGTSSAGGELAIASSSSGVGSAVASMMLDRAAGPVQASTMLGKLPPGFAEVSASEIKLIESIGEGSFGEVWLALWCETLCACKIMSTKHSSSSASLQQRDALKSLKAESMLMSGLRHPNVCQYLGVCMDPPCLIMEYCPKKSLDSLLAEARNGGKVRAELTWERLLRFCLDAATGMLYLHTRSPPVAHRDLKSANLLVDSEWRVKVADFNLSRPLDAATGGASTVLMTNPRWLAPCVLSGTPGQLAADVWAFGTTLWEILTWELPFANVTNAFRIIALVREQGADALPTPANDQLPAGPLSADLYQEYVSLMRDCRSVDPAARPGFDVIVRRLRAMVEAEAQARQPAKPAAKAPSPPSKVVHVLPPSGPAYKAASDALRRLQAAKRRESSSAGSSQSGSAEPGPAARSAPAVPGDAAEPPAPAGTVIVPPTRADTGGPGPSSPFPLDGAALAKT